MLGAFGVSDLPLVQANGNRHHHYHHYQPHRRQHHHQQQQQQQPRRFTVVTCASLSAGYMKNPTTMVEEWVTWNPSELTEIPDDLTWNQEKPSTDLPKLVINYNFRKLVLYFTWKGEDYKAEYDFRDLEVHSLHPENAANDYRAYFTIIGKYPPQYWVTDVRYRNQRHDTVPWERVTRIARFNFVGVDNDRGENWRPLQRQADVEQYLDLGQWTAFRVRVASRALARFDEVRRHAAPSRLVPRPNPRHDRYDRIFVERARATGGVYTASQLRGEVVGLAAAAGQPSLSSLDFDKYYTLESYFSRRYITPATVDQAFYKIYSQLTARQARVALRYMLAAEEMNDYDYNNDNDSVITSEDDGDSSTGSGSTRGGRHIWNPTKALRDLMRQSFFAEMGEKRSPNKAKTKKDHVDIQKVYITPTSIILELPQAEPANRVVRHFKDHVDRFLRVQFVEEGQRRLLASSRPYHNSGQLYRRVAHALSCGIQIGERHYEFLAYSSSQLREHGCWFFASTDTLNAAKIRSWMGDFSKEKVVAKYAARMGQCFSSTYPTVNLKKSQLLDIKDVKRNGYTFSDGVGQISSSLAMMVATKMRLPGTSYPSAFQFRLGGAKGVLSVTSKVAGGKLALRPSQKKFESEHSMLEINRASSRSVAFLNRQIIIILSSLGVPDEVFHDLLRELLEELDCITSDPDRCIAALRRSSDEDGIARDMADIVQAGFLASGDPYIAHMLHVYRLSKLKEAKARAKIPVVKGAHILGVLDETNTLREGEVFCQLSDYSHTGASSLVITGECLVYRSPALHPGDARVLKAVDCDELRTLHNVIVFSQQGERDIPSMLAGGDLDGDTYSIIWDKRLYPSQEMRNKEPMAATQEEPKRVSNVSISHIHDFFVEYIENDNLGQIATAHLVRADEAGDGVLNAGCMELAELHSKAVDFPKTGLKAIMPGDMRVRVYPDFMEKRDRPMRESPKILGQLYRHIESGEFQNYRKQLRTKKTEYDARLRYPGMDMFRDEAWSLKHEYDDDLLSLMDQFGIRTEAEFMTGCIIRYKNKNENKSYFELRRQARREMIRFREHWRHNHFASLRKRARKAATPEQIEQDKAKAAAFYYVTYDPDEQEKARLYYGSYRGKDDLLLSFAWLGQELLCQILKQHYLGQHPPPQPPQQEPVIEVEKAADDDYEFFDSDFGDEIPVSDDDCY